MGAGDGARTGFERYLRLLGVPARPPGLAALAELTSAHLSRVPFENVSKLLHRRDPAMRLPPLERWLDGIERHRFGGTCYANNSRLGELLAHLGYEVRLCGADMSRPDVHVVNVVRLDGREYLVDVGYGAPFHAPLALDANAPQEVELGADRYVLHPRDDAGRSRMDLVRDGRLRHGYSVNPAPRSIGEFAGVIEESFAGSASFMNALVIVRHAPGRSLALRNMSLVESEGLMHRRTLVATHVDELPEVAETRFGMPRTLVRLALVGVDPSRDVWS